MDKLPQNVVPLNSAENNAIEISDRTMSDLPSDMLAFRIWDALNGLEDVVSAESAADWADNQHDTYCDILDALICARVLARRLTGMEPSDISAELQRRFRIAAGLPVDGGAA
ncbi:hypothetical protein G7008_03500 [Pseudomonas psychrotolerans]|uniref:hypothetical protein n=1 Tax=Pseudomonas oryzihabitans TaxID=47885 RepID=UPI0015E36208|nr:hypothetical protein [Pseudomonas psychrotolerans]MBA1179560.1 hypothetical protein [Pseudomonas psychrotolerans]MBA1212163.1 hypothetical protein [Pseudomonas psychrotolerans]